MRTTVLTAFLLWLALTHTAQAQKIHDFTVDPTYAGSFPVTINPEDRNQPRLTLSPRISRDEIERFEPVGSNEGPPLVGLSASRFSEDRRTAWTVKLFGEIDAKTSTGAPYREVLSPKKERIITLGFSQSFD